MLYTFSPNIVITSFKNGKIFSDVVTNESFFIDEEIFQIIQPASERYVTINEIYNENYTFEEFVAFIEDLIDNGILIRHSTAVNQP